VIINGYTDLKGGIDYNKNLSLKRALAVKKKILNLGYVDEINLEVIGNGEYYPEIRNEDINRRRVEIEFNTKENSVFCN
jgi:outer membrane protein OmpA-like peptidoglycan-associated protein